MPPVGVEDRAACGPLGLVPTLRSDAARGAVVHRVVQVEPVKPDGLERPVRKNIESFGRKAVTSRLRNRPVRDLGPPFFQVNGAQTDPADRASAPSHHPVGTVFQLPSQRPCGDPLARFLRVDFAHMPTLDVRIRVGPDEELGIAVRPRLELYVAMDESGLDLIGENAPAQDGRHQRGHSRSIDVRRLANGAPRDRASLCAADPRALPRRLRGKPGRSRDSAQAEPAMACECRRSGAPSC